MLEQYRYICYKNESIAAAADWDGIPAVKLVETVTGGKTRLFTEVKACWTDQFVSFRFECEDDHIVATYTERDEPIYNEDVVEVFIDEAGNGRHYQEYEVSPHNVIFDALVDNDLAGTIAINTDWDAEGIETSVAQVAADRYIYSINIPHVNFSTVIQAGLEWNVNFYRIDDDQEGTRHYWAWSPTQAANFHLPARFGRLIFA